MTAKVMTFAGLLVVICGGGAWLVTVIAKDPMVTRAAWMSAAVACGVQLIGFAAARVMVARKVGIFAAWGVATVVRFVSLVVYALLVFKVLGLVPAPALVTYAGLLMLTSIVEPMFLTER